MKQFTDRIQFRLNKIPCSPVPVHSKSSPMLISYLQSQTWTESCQEVQKNVIDSNSNLVAKMITSKSFELIEVFGLCFF